MELIETVRVERGRAVLISYHYRRLRRGALSLGFPLNLSKQDFEKLLVNRWKEDGGGIKLVRFSLSENGSFSVSSRDCLKRERVRLKSVYSVKRFYSAVSTQKTSTGAEISKFAFEEAKKLGYDEAITYSPEGFVSECAFANLFFFKDGILFTPSLKTGCLRGTRREFILELAEEMGIPIVEGFFKVEELLKADEVFITSAREDTCLVVEIDGFKLKEPQGKPIFRRIREVIEWIEFKGHKAP